MHILYLILLYLILLYFTIKVSLQDFFYFGIRLTTFYGFIIFLIIFLFFYLGTNIYLIIVLLVLLGISILLDVISFILNKEKKIAIDLNIIPIADIIFILSFIIETLFIIFKIVIPGRFNFFFFVLIIFVLLVISIYLCVKYYYYIKNLLNIKKVENLTEAIVSFYEKNNISKIEIIKESLKFKQKNKEKERVYIPVFFVLGTIQIFYLFLFLFYA